jgi:hypothetical protein
MNDITYVGLDVHKATVCVAIAESGRGGEVREVEGGKLRDEADHLGADPVNGHRRPPLIIMPPHADALAGLLRRDEPRKNGFLGSGCRDGNDVWQDARKPGHLPFCALAKHSLHINAKMNRAFARRAVP